MKNSEVKKFVKLSLYPSNPCKGSKMRTCPVRHLPQRVLWIVLQARHIARRWARNTGKSAATWHLYHSSPFKRISLARSRVADPHSFDPESGPNPDPEFWRPKLEKKITAEKKINFFWDQKLQVSYPQAFIKNIQVTEEAFSSQKRTSSTSKHEISKFFLLLWVIFGLLDPNPIRIWIRNPGEIIADL